MAPEATSESRTSPSLHTFRGRCWSSDSKHNWGARLNQPAPKSPWLMHPKPPGSFSEIQMSEPQPRILNRNIAGLVMRCHLLGTDPQGLPGHLQPETPSLLHCCVLHALATPRGLHGPAASDLPGSLWDTRNLGPTPNLPNQVNGVHNKVQKALADAWWGKNKQTRIIWEASVDEHYIVVNATDPVVGLLHVTQSGTQFSDLYNGENAVPASQDWGLSKLPQSA